MNTFYSNGKRIQWTNSTGSAVTAGTPVSVRSGTSGITGVAVTDIANGATGTVSICGVHALTAATGAISQGAVVYRDNSTNAITTTSTSNHLAGYVVLAKTTAATTAYVLLNGLPGAE